MDGNGGSSRGIAAALRRHLRETKAERVPVVIHLPADAHAYIKAKATERGVEPNELILDLMAAGIEPLQKQWKKGRRYD